MQSGTNPGYPGDGRYALTHHKTITPLLGSALKIWLSKPSVFIAAALLVILPIEIIVIGVLGGGFSDPDGVASDGMTLLDAVLVGWFGVSLITAAHARAVVAIAAGERVTTASALRLGGGAFLPVLGAALIYGLACMVGTLLLIIPGIWISVAGIFATQIAALTRTGIGESLVSSVKLVRAAGWWRTFGYYLLVTLIALLPVIVVSLVVALLTEGIGNASISGPLNVVVVAIVTALIYSWTALVTSLLYFSWRAKVGDPWGSEAASAAPDLDAGPDWDPARSSALGNAG